MTNPARRLPANESTVTDPAALPDATPVTLDEDVLIDEARQLEITWRDGGGLWGWLTTVDHKVIARRYIITAFLMFIAGGLEAGMMRMQLARPENTLLGPDRYNQIFTTHGTTMMFLFAVPIMTAMGLYFVPLMVGARSIAFPRLNAFGYYTYLMGVVFLYVSLFINMGPDAGWTAYVPLSGPQYSPGHRVDVWAQLVTFTEIAALAAAVNIIVTTFKMRAPGMSLNRIPLFVWAQLVVAFMIVFAMPAVAIASTLQLASDRAIATHWFNPAEGGDALLWQHIFWFFGHPEVYIIFLPGLGFITPIVETFSRRRVFGYTAIVLANITTGFFAFGLWVHHMFATPIPELGQSLFTAASMIIAIPTGVQIFCWLVTMFSGRPRLTTAMVFILGFFITFVNGGLTGVMLASVGFDKQVHDTFFVVAHLHYVLLGGAVIPLFAAFYFWFPKVTGRLMNERLGKWQAWLFIVGVNVTFFPMHILGLNGMPRRIYTYLSDTGWGPLNELATAGAVIIVVSVALLVINAAMSWRGGVLAGANPWDSYGLEWATPSPAPNYNFLNTPVVLGRHPLWDTGSPLPVITGLRTDRREVLVTTTFDAQPDHRHKHPHGSIWPVILSLVMAELWIGSIFTPWAVLGGVGLTLLSMLGWGWQSTQETDVERVATEGRMTSPSPTRQESLGSVRDLPTVTFGHRSLMWWGTLGFMTIEGWSLALIAAMYFYIRQNFLTWPPITIPLPSLTIPTINLVVMIVSVVPAWLADRAARRLDLAGVKLWLLISSLISLPIPVLRWYELWALNVRWDTNAYGSAAWLLVGSHATLLILDVADTVGLTLFYWFRRMPIKAMSDTSDNSFYWYFMVAIWVPVYLIVYVGPYVF